MKKIQKTILFIFILSASVPIFAQETKPKESKAGTADSKPATNEKKTDPNLVLSARQVSSEMSVIWCDKLQECSPETKMKTPDCRRVLRVSFEEGFKNASKDSDSLKVTRGSLDECIQNVESADCEGLKSAKGLGGCEFIGLLNRN